MDATVDARPLINAPMNVAQVAIIRRGSARELTIQAVYNSPTAQGAFKLEATAKWTGDATTSKWSDASSDFPLPGANGNPNVSGSGDFLIVYGGGNAPPIRGEAFRLTWTPTNAGTTQPSDLLDVFAKGIA